MEIIYLVEIAGKQYKFSVKQNYDGKILFIVPDVGGQADMVPKFPEQLEWTEKQLRNIKGADKIWPTVWEMNMENPIETIEKLLSEDVKILKTERY